MLYGIRKGEKKTDGKYYRNDSEKDGYCFDLSDGTQVYLKPGDIVVLSPHERIINACMLDKSCIITELSKAKMDEELKNIKVATEVGSYEDVYEEIMSKTNDEIIAIARSWNSKQRINMLKKKCIEADKPYSFISKLDELINSAKGR